MGKSSSLEDLWRAALAQPIHGAACGCSAPSPIVVTAALLELHLLDFLEERHALQTNEAWTAAVADRTSCPRGRFVRWLEGLACLDGALKQQLLADVAAVLHNMVDHSRVRLRPSASYGRVWLVPG